MSEEGKSQSAELSDEEVANATGGELSSGGDPKPPTMSGSHTCEHCGKTYNYNTTKPGYTPKCKYCNYNPMTGKIEPDNATGISCL